MIMFVSKQYLKQLLPRNEIFLFTLVVLVMNIKIIIFFTRIYMELS